MSLCQEAQLNNSQASNIFSYVKRTEVDLDKYSDMTCRQSSTITKVDLMI